MGNNPVNLVDPDGEWGMLVVALGFKATIYGSSLLNSWIQGESAESGAQKASALINKTYSRYQIQVYKGSNGSSFSVGFDPFFLSFSASVSGRSGDTFYSGGFGAGPAGYGAFGSAGRRIGNSSISVGVGGGPNHIGYGVDVQSGDFGGGYYRTHFGNAIGPDGNPNPQTLGGLKLRAGVFSLNISNDVHWLSGQDEDRWRTTVAEIGLWGVTIGSEVYTNMPDKKLDPNLTYCSITFRCHDFGTYADGKVFSSPIYLSFKHGGFEHRIGWNHPMIQDWTQNAIHKYVSKSPYFKTPIGAYNEPYLFSRFRNPYSLY